ncbi:TPA: stage II sporulation protein M [Streptococcus pneumoniae]
MLSLGIQLGISGQMIGIVATIKGILPHALIEIPNFIWYQGMSQYLLYRLLKDRGIKNILIYIKSNLKWYIISYLLLILAALIEGIKL